MPHLKASIVAILPNRLPDVLLELNNLCAHRQMPCKQRACVFFEMNMICLDRWLTCTAPPTRRLTCAQPVVTFCEVCDQKNTMLTRSQPRPPFRTRHRKSQAAGILQVQVLHLLTEREDHAPIADCAKLTLNSTSCPTGTLQVCCQTCPSVHFKRNARFTSQLPWTQSACHRFTSNLHWRNSILPVSLT